MLPQYWTDFLEQNTLLGSEITIPDVADKSGVGAEFDFMTEQAARAEAQEFYPGIAVSAGGYVPVGNCLIGTGDPYFINTKDGPFGPLYRVYHDAVSESGYNPKEAIDVVLESYKELLKYRSD